MSAGIIRPALVWLRKGSLDRDLAHGADPHASPELERRSQILVSARFRAGLAAALCNVIDAAEEPPRPLSSAVPLQRRRVRENRPLLLQLEEDLRASGDVTPRGVALAEQLLTDGGSPLYAPSPEGSLEAAIRHARAALLLR